MTIASTIPDKIPKRLIREIKKEKYDSAILFALAVYGSHKMKELVNDPKNLIENRMDKEIFQRWAVKLTESNFIKEYNLDNEVYFKITSEGEDELMNVIENNSVLRIIKNRLISTFDEFFGESIINEGADFNSKSRYTLSYKDYVFGLFSIDWRLTEINAAGNNSNSLKPDDNMSFGNLLDYNAEHYGNRPALLYEDIKYTYKELNEWTNRYANFFLSIGLKKGDVINVFLENRPELMMIIGAMGKIGTIASLINTRQRSASLIHSFTVNNVKTYVIGEEMYSVFLKVMKDLKLTSKDKLYFLTDKDELEIPEGFINLKEKIKDQATSTPSAIREIKGIDPYAYVFTSGTTGLPKAAPMRHIHMMSSTYGWGVIALNMQPEDIIYISLPLFHSNPIHIGLASAFRGGSAVALARKFSVSNFWNDVRKYKATCFNYIGELCRYLLNQAPDSEDRNHNVYKICGNGLRPEIWKEFKERFGIRYVYEHYGATEIRAMFCNYFNRDYTIGINFHPHALVKYDISADRPIQDENGFFQKVEEGEAGLLIMKITGPTIFAGYTDKVATKKKILENPFGNGESWLNTGDLLRNIGFSHAQFVDRLGDTFRWKGENVSTSEVEDIFSSFNQIEHSSVYGVEIPGTDGRAGMASIISTKDCQNFDFNGLLSILKTNLPQYAIPIFIRFLSELSTTSTFKIRKVKTKEEGYNIKKITDPIYILLPGNKEYTRLSEIIYKNIGENKYRF
ncbi:MAG: long-chain-acyl-CoA synthetase [Promethearchaeota archaeon]